MKKYEKNNEEIKSQSLCRGILEFFQVPEPRNMRKHEEIWRKYEQI